MKKQIQEVHDYFADKIARGLYKVVKIEESYIVIIVDGLYKFALWTMHSEMSFGVWGNDTSFMKAELTDKQRASGYSIAIKHRAGWENTEKKEKDLAELKRLQEKYGSQL